MEEVKKILSKKDSKSESFWIMLFRIPGVIIFFLPFVPVTISYINSNVDKVGLENRGVMEAMDLTAYFFVIITILKFAYQYKNRF